MAGASAMVVEILWWLAGLMLGAFLGVAFFQPLMAGLVPARVRFLSFKVGKRLRLRKVEVETTVRTVLSIPSENPISWNKLRDLLLHILPPNSTFDLSQRRFHWKDPVNGISYDIDLGTSDEPEEIVVTGSLGKLRPNGLATRLLIFHVWWFDLVTQLNKRIPAAFEPSKSFHVEGVTSWEPDLIRFLRDAAGTREGGGADVNLSIAPKEGGFPVSFSDRKIRATGDLGNAIFVERLKDILTLYA